MFKKKTSGKGQKKSATWSNDKVNDGKVRLGWKAGDPIWILAHFIGRSVPCYADLTDGKLDCPHCRTRPRLDKIGYLPWYHESGKPYVVVVQDYAEELLDQIKLFAPIQITRGKDKGNPIVVRQVDWTKPYVSTHPVRSQSADIRDSLLTIWKEPSLIEFYRGELELPDLRTAVSRAEESRAQADADTQVLRDRVQQHLKVRGQTSTASDNGLSLHTAFDVVTAPSRNGVHHSKPPKRGE